MEWGGTGGGGGRVERKTETDSFGFSYCVASLMFGINGECVVGGGQGKSLIFFCGEYDVTIFSIGGRVVGVRFGRLGF